MNEKNKPEAFSRIAENLKIHKADKLKGKLLEELFFMLREGNKALSNTAADEIRRRLEEKPAPEGEGSQPEDKLYKTARALLDYYDQVGPRAFQSRYGALEVFGVLSEDCIGGGRGSASLARDFLTSRFMLDIICIRLPIQ